MFLHAAFPSHPRRIISLVPSITELLFDLNLTEETIGITKFCIHPHNWFQSKEKIGGTKNLNIEKINALKPDLIIANREENTKEQVNILAKSFPVYLTDVGTYEDAIKMIIQIGEITAKNQEAINLVSKIETSFQHLQKPSQLIDTLYLIWKDPYMTVGGDTFINDLIKKIGLKNVFEHYDRYPQLTVENIIATNPSLVLLSSEPYPFKEKHVKALQAILPNAKIHLVDGEMFSWYGSRMKYMPEYFNNLLHQISSI